MESLTTSNLLTLAHVATMLLCMAVSVFLYRRTADTKALEAVREAHDRASGELKTKMTALTQELRISSARDGEMHTRISILETQMRHVPTHQDLILIKNELKDLNSTVAAVNERSESTVEMVQSIHKYLLERNRP